MSIRIFNRKFFSACLALLLSTTVFAQGGPPGGGTPTGAGNVTEAIADLEADLLALSQQVTDLDSALSGEIALLASDVNDLDTELSGEIALLSAELTALGNDVETDLTSLFNAVQGLGVNFVSIDCGLDSTALQNAVDAASPSGSVISVTGTCGSTSLLGKSNIVIDGAGTGGVTADDGGASVAALYIEASNNIQITGMTVDANGNDSSLAAWDSNVFIYNSDFLGTVDINRGSFAAVANIDVNAPFRVFNNSTVISDEDFDVGDGTQGLSVLFSSTFNQISGSIDIQGTVTSGFSSTVFLNAGEVFVVPSPNSFTTQHVSQRGSTLRATGTTITGNLSAFSGGSIDLSSATVTGSSMLVQRNAQAFIIGGDINLPEIRLRQGAILDVLGGQNGNMNSPSVSIESGSGVRWITAPIVAVLCGESIWTDFNISCPVPLPAP